MAKFENITLNGKPLTSKDVSRLTGDRKPCKHDYGFVIQTAHGFGYANFRGTFSEFTAVRFALEQDYEVTVFAHEKLDIDKCRIIMAESTDDYERSTMSVTADGKDINFECDNRLYCTDEIYGCRIYDCDGFKYTVERS